jgi:hypothetical protein
MGFVLFSEQRTVVSVSNIEQSSFVMGKSCFICGGNLMFMCSLEAVLRQRVK